MPAPATETTVLKDGFWERTAVVTLPAGETRVRKQSKPGPGQPWATAALRREIAFLRDLPDDLARHFPRLLDHWDGDAPGYDSTYFPAHTDLATLLLDDRLSQEAADAVQVQLIEIVRHGLHARPAPADTPPLSRHVVETLHDVARKLAALPALAPLVDTPELVINDTPAHGLAAALERLPLHPDLLAGLDAETALLHGDLIPENVLVDPADPASVILVDPVSVAGLAGGHPLFDLAKYTSYASGELFALRNGAVAAAAEGDNSYTWKIDWADERVARFWRTDLYGCFAASFGDPDRDTLALLDAYFSLAMAANTTGTQQLARTLKGLALLTSFLSGS